MPVKQGTFGTSPIYNGEYKIGKIYNGENLVYQSLLPILVRYAQDQLIDIKEDDLDGVTKISSSVFSNKTNLKSILIPNTVTSIEDSAFTACSNLENIIIPNSVKTLGENTFASCISLQSIILPSSITDIGIANFYSCTNLSSAYIYFTSSTTKVTNNTSGWFYNCNSMSIIHIPKSVTDPATAYGQYWNYNYANSTYIEYIADL